MRPFGTSGKWMAKLALANLSLAAACLANSDPIALGELPREAVSVRYDQLFKGLEKPTADPIDVKLYKLRYPSTDFKGKPVSLSGLLAYPKGQCKGLVLYFHGTTADRGNVPSRYDGDRDLSEAEYAVMAFASGGYAVAAPDYLGLGDSPGIHPYALSRVNSRSGLDMVQPAFEALESAGIQTTNRIFISGYSEGGGVAMWATRLRQEQGLPVFRSAPLLGPYDLSGTQAHAMLSDHSNFKWLGASVYFSAYAAYALQKLTGDFELTDCFITPFATYVPYVFGQKLDDVERAKKLSIKAWQCGEFTSLRKILKPSLQEALKTRDVTHPVVAALVKNDCYDWSPNSETYLVTLEDDFLVPKENALRAVAAMRIRGVGPDKVRAYVIPGRKYNHISGLTPALILARKFFDGGFAAVPSRTK